MVKKFNLRGDEWDATRDRDGWRVKGTLVGRHVLFARPGPAADYWEGEE
jgi:hypothetical protein